MPPNAESDDRLEHGELILGVTSSQELGGRFFKARPRGDADCGLPGETGRAKKGSPHEELQHRLPCLLGAFGAVKA
jgi:hypothetical protein